MKIENIDLTKLRTTANQLKHYNRQIKNYNYCLILYDYNSKKEFYFNEEEIFNYNGNNKKDRYKKDIYDFKNYINDNFKPYSFKGYCLSYSKYLEEYTSKQKLLDYKIKLIQSIERTFKSEDERDFFIKHIQYLNEKELFDEYLKYFGKLRDSEKRFNNILKSIQNKTVFFNLDKKNIPTSKIKEKHLQNLNSEENLRF